MADKGKKPLPPALIELQELRFRGIPSIYDKLSSMKKMDKSLKEYTTGKLPQLRENIKKLSDEYDKLTASSSSSTQHIKRSVSGPQRRSRSETRKSDINRSMSGPSKVKFKQEESYIEEPISKSQEISTNTDQLQQEILTKLSSVNFTDALNTIKTLSSEGREEEAQDIVKSTLEQSLISFVKGEIKEDEFNKIKNSLSSVVKREKLQSNKSSNNFSPSFKEPKVKFAKL